MKRLTHGKLYMSQWYNDSNTLKLHNRLAVYEEAEEQGTLLRLAVPIGATVRMGNKIGRVYHIDIWYSGHVYWAETDTDEVFHFMASDVGKTVFVVEDKHD